MQLCNFRTMLGAIFLNWNLPRAACDQCTNGKTWYGRSSYEALGLLALNAYYAFLTHYAVPCTVLYCTLPASNTYTGFLPCIGPRSCLGCTWSWCSVLSSLTATRERERERQNKKNRMGERDRERERSANRDICIYFDACVWRCLWDRPSSAA